MFFLNHWHWHGNRNLLRYLYFYSGAKEEGIFRSSTGRKREHQRTGYHDLSWLVFLQFSLYFIIQIKDFFFTFINYYLIKGNNQRKKKRNKEKKKKKKARKKAQKKSASSPGKKTNAFFCIHLNIYLNCVSVDVAEEIMSKGKFLDSWVTLLLQLIHIFFF